MALRVARKLFGLWLLLSVLWIGGVGVVTLLLYPHPPSRVEYYAHPELYTPTPQERFERDVRIIADDQRWTIKAAIIIALVPPVILLALGSALVWAFRKFW